MTAERMPMRYRIGAGVLGLSLAASLGVSAAFAQEDDATPGTEATPGAETAPAEEGPAEPDFVISPEGETRLAEGIQQVSETIETVQADRDAAGLGDTTTIDQLLEQASSLLDQARQSLDSGATEDVPRQTMAASAAALAAEALIRAQLSDYGLPSQQAGASRTLDTAYRQIKDVTDATADETDEDVAFFVTTAQELYRQAYDLYNAGTYAQAVRTARVGAALSRVAELLSSDVVAFAEPGERGIVELPDIRGRDRRDGPVRGHWEDGPIGGVIDIGPGGLIGPIVVDGDGWFDELPAGFSSESPIEVPEPEF